MSFILNPFRFLRGYVPEQSIQFSAADNQYLTYTPAAPEADRTRGIFVAWVKFAGQQTPDFYETLLLAVNGGAYTRICRNSGNTPAPAYTPLVVFHDGFERYKTNALFRDVTAHTPIVVSIDTNASVGDRVRFYRGHDLLPTTVTNEYTLADVLEIGNTVPHYLCGDASTYDFDGVATEPRWLPGVSIQNGDFTTYDFFGEDAAGVPVPIRPAPGVYGTTGWLVEDSTGADQSGNGNDWTPVNTPTDSSDVPADKAIANLGNYPIFNVLSPMTYEAAVAQAGLQVSCSTYKGAIASIPLPSTGKVYWEVNSNKAPDGNTICGVVANTNVALGASGYFPGGANQPGSYGFAPGTASAKVQKVTGGTFTDLAQNKPGISGTMQFAWDGDTGSLWFGYGDAWNGDPEARTGAAFTGITGDVFPAVWGYDNIYYGYLGAEGFTLTCPTGFNPLCTAHLPDETVTTPQTGSFTGNASADGPFVDLGFTPNQSGTCTINGNTITWGTHALPTAGGFKVITSSSSYNAAGANTYSIAVSGTFAGPGASQARAQLVA